MQCLWIIHTCDFFVQFFFQESKNFPMQPTYVSCYERFAQLWELVKVNSNTRLWEEEMLNPLTGLDAVKIETECCFLRHQYSTADWTKAAYSGEKKRSVRREKHKSLCFARVLVLYRSLWYYEAVVVVVEREIMCNNIANRSPYINNIFSLNSQMYWTSFF